MLQTHKRERAILVGLASVQANRWLVNDYLDELSLLADTAGADVIFRMVQERSEIDAAYFIGRGKAEQLARIAGELDADVIIFDDDLSPAQARNLEKLCGKKVIDRSGLILDIFARRAKTREAKTQVELAQLRYLLPRLTRQWTHLSRQVGGIGTRGPGETQLEVDRRLIRKRITNLVGELKKIEKQRQMRRKHREGIFKAALVGYTNVGKSTLMNVLTDSQVYIENRLFATLDATVRAMPIADHEFVLLIDTVGFIRKLPHHLVASFKSTLEEVHEADLLIHVIDIANPYFEDQMRTVQQVLDEMNVNGKQSLYVFNKIDRLENRALIDTMKEKYQPSVFVSAARGLFLDDLRRAILEIVHLRTCNVTARVPASDGAALAKMYELAEVTSRDIENDTIILRFRTTPEKLARLKARLNSRIEFVEEPTAHSADEGH
ncbi:MAG: GTPase HflX [candidate division KSB1 bacterium]|nr:GTPase HflX [candidate division KSB1 bacterium]MDQ7064599.1 GTPase HflX [candidate division KSB1 bacterium]